MKRATVIVVFLALAVPPAGTAWAASSYTFRGGGWGHGVGASQYGAYGLAQKGWGLKRIVTQYYAGTDLQIRNPPTANVRVGLLQNRDTITITAEQESFTLQLQNGNFSHEVPQGKTRRVEISGGKYHIYNQNDNLVGGKAWGSASNELRVIRSPGGVIGVGQWGHAIGRGPRMAMPIVASNRAHLVAVVPFEQYLYGIAEIPASWPAKVQRFQAILARTYAYEKIGRVGNNRADCRCGLLATTADQHYTGRTKETSFMGDRWVDGVNRTARRVVTYGGDPIQAYYSSSSGGMVDNVKAVWGGSLPYLKKRCDPGDFTSANPNRTWSLNLSDTEAATRLRNRFGWNIARVTAINVLKRGPGGHLSSVRVRGKNSGGGDVSFTTTGENLRRGLSLKSARVWINRNRQVTGQIRRRYDNINCKPGLARTAQKSAAGGVWQRFQKGRMYSKSGAGNRWIHGPTLNRYLNLNGPKGRLGYPTSNVRRLSNNRDRVLFEGGRITCNRSTKKCNVKYG